MCIKFAAPFLVNRSSRNLTTNCAMCTHHCVLMTFSNVLNAERKWFLLGFCFLRLNQLYFRPRRRFLWSNWIIHWLYSNCSFAASTAQNAVELQRLVAPLPGPSNLHAENERERALDQQHQVVLPSPSHLHTENDNVKEQEQPRRVLVLPSQSNSQAGFTTRRNDLFYQPERRRRLNDIQRQKLELPVARIRLFYDGQSNSKH